MAVEIVTLMILLSESATDMETLWNKTGGFNDNTLEKHLLPVDTIIAAGSFRSKLVEQWDTFGFEEVHLVGMNMAGDELWFTAFNASETSFAMSSWLTNETFLGASDTTMDIPVILTRDSNYALRISPVNAMNRSWFAVTTNNLFTYPPLPAVFAAKLPSQPFQYPKLITGYLGCWPTSVVSNYTFQYNVSATGDNTPEMCIAACDGYNAAILMKAHFCYCGNYGALVESDDGLCHHRCPGDNSQFCGGYFAMYGSVYHIQGDIYPGEMLTDTFYTYTYTGSIQSIQVDWLDIVNSMVGEHLLITDVSVTSSVSGRFSLSYSHQQCDTASADDTKVYNNGAQQWFYIGTELHVGIIGFRCLTFEFDSTMAQVNIELKGPIDSMEHIRIPVVAIQAVRTVPDSSTMSSSSTAATTQSTTQTTDISTPSSSTESTSGSMSTLSPQISSTTSTAPTSTTDVSSPTSSTTSTLSSVTTTSTSTTSTVSASTTDASSPTSSTASTTSTLSSVTTTSTPTTSTVSASTTDASSPTSSTASTLSSVTTTSTPTTSTLATTESSTSTSTASTFSSTFNFSTSSSTTTVTQPSSSSTSTPSTSQTQGSTPTSSVTSSTSTVQPSSTLTSAQTSSSTQTQGSSGQPESSSTLSQSASTSPTTVTASGTSITPEPPITTSTSSEAPTTSPTTCQCQCNNYTQALNMTEEDLRVSDVIVDINPLNAGNECNVICKQCWLRSEGSRIIPLIREKVLSIQEKLAVNVSQLSSTIRKLTSAEDNRPSAMSIGFLGVTLLVGVFGTIFLIDASTLLRDFRLLKNNIKSRFCHQDVSPS